MEEGRGSIPGSPAPSTAPEAIEDQPIETDMPMTMAASVVLTTLPEDSKKALEKAAEALSGPLGIPAKVTVHFHALRDAPSLKQTRYKITSSQPFGNVIASLRKKLRLTETSSVWCYVGNFSPSPDERIDNLYACFKTGDELKVGYSITPTFG